MTCKNEVLVIGGGLAGSEAAYYLASRGVKTTLVDMKPKKFTPAHENVGFGELVCSNSLKSNDMYANACGLLKEEMRLCGSLIIEAADNTRVPAGAALAVDREKFSAYITEKLKACENLTVRSEEVLSLPEPEKKGGQVRNYCDRTAHRGRARRGYKEQIRRQFTLLRRVCAYRFGGKYRLYESVHGG